MDIRFPKSLPRLAAAIARRRMPNSFALSQIQPKAKASVSWKTSSSGIMEFRAMRTLTGRALEQIKNDVCYSDNPVKLIGISAGVSYGALGTTHHSLHDLAALRAINNIDIVVPADNLETREVIKLAAQRSKPIYIRFGKAPLYDLKSE